MTDTLRLERVGRTYGTPPVQALVEVDLTVAAGELVAVVGPSGSGKSTLLNVMGTLDRPTAGRVLIDGVDVVERSDRQLSALRARRIGFVFQSFHLGEGVRTLDIVADGLLYTGLPRRRRRRAGPVGPGPRRTGPPHRPSRAPAVGRRASARRHRARRRRRPAVAARRRADRQPGLRLGRERRRAPARAARGRHHDRRDHPRHRAGREPPALRVGPGRSRRRRHRAMLIAPSRLRAVDLLRLGTAGLRTRPARAVLSALGVAIGIAAMVAVVGISASSQERLQRRLAALGTNLLTATITSVPGGPTALPADAAGRVRRIPACSTPRPSPTSRASTSTAARPSTRTRPAASW